MKNRDALTDRMERAKAYAAKNKTSGKKAVFDPEEKDKRCVWAIALYR